MDKVAELLEFVAMEGRVAPAGKRWHELWQLLPGQKQVPAKPDGPPVPLILGASDAPDPIKRQRLRAQIEYAVEHGAFEDVNRFLRSLPPDQWDRE